MRRGINFIDKLNFLTSYNQVYTETYLLNIIRNRFKAIKLIPYNLIRVLSTFQIERKTFISPNNSYGNYLSSWILKMLRTLR